MICVQGEGAAKQIHMKLLYPQIIDKASLSVCAYFCSGLVSVLGCKSLGTVPHHVAQNCSNAFRGCITSTP